LVSGGKAAGKAAEGIIAKAVKDLLRVGAKDAERRAAKDALHVAERDAAKKAEQDAAKKAEQDAARSLEKRALEGDPVDIASGAVVQHQVDVELPGLLPLVLSRTHLSSYRLGGWFGVSWASTLDQRLVFSGGGVRFVAADGSVLDYPRAADVPALGARPRLDRDRLTVTERDQTLHFTQFFGADGVPSWPLTAITDRNGHRIDIDRSATGVPLVVRHSGGYRVEVLTTAGRVVGYRLGDTDLVRFAYTDGHLTSVINSSGLPLRFGYDDDGRLTRWEDRNGHWYAYRYDAAGRCVAGEGAGGYLNATFRYEDRLTVLTNSLGAATTYHLNTAGQVVREVDPLGHTTTSRWDAYDRLLSRTDPLGRTTAYTYDEAGNLTTLTRPDGSAFTTTYNSFGQPLTITEPDGATWHREYDERGNLTAITNPAGATTRYAHDPAGRLSAVTDALGNTRQVATNPAGLPISETDPMGRTTVEQRDVFGRIVALTDAGGGTTQYRWSVEGDLIERTWPDGSTESWSYDGERNPVGYRDALGSSTTIETGPFDLPAAQVGPDGTRTEFRYDLQLRLAAVTNAVGRTWHYQYDPAGRLTGELDFDGRSLGYRYDTAGQLSESVNGAGETVRYVRDRVGNVIEEHAGDAVSTFAYDPTGRLLHATGPDAELSIQLDALGRVLSETCNGRTVSSRYDALGRRVYRQTPSGTRSEWEYQADSQPAVLRVAGQAVRFGYDQSGREVARRIGAGALLTRTFDPRGRVASQVLTADGPEPASPGRLVQRRVYSYLRTGGLVGMDDHLLGNHRYDLDAAGRVRSVDGPHGRERYEYDPTGKMVAGTGADARYEHDAQGRTTTRHVSGQSWRYTWDAADRLTSVVTPGGQRWGYRYDPLGRRIAKQRLAPDGTVTEQIDFVWDGPVLAEQTGGGRSTVWDWEPGTFRPVAQTVDDRFYAIVTDLIGTPTELVDGAGELAWRRQSTLWGQPIAGADGVNCPLAFPGQYHDPESGLNYNFFRYYDPATALYQSPDPLGLAPSFNPYAYVHNPTAWLDPLGLSPYELPGRSGALNQAKRDLGIPRGQHPEAVDRVPLTDKWGQRILDENKQPIMTREYTYVRPNGDRVVIQDHAVGHDFGEGGVGNQGPHFNVRPPENTRTGHVPGTSEHYPFGR
jgi:RHS repeat-associated protein